VILMPKSGKIVFWHVPVTGVLDQAVEKAVRRDMHSTKADLMGRWIDDSDFSIDDLRRIVGDHFVREHLKNLREARAQGKEISKLSEVVGPILSRVAVEIEQKHRVKTAEVEKRLERLEGVESERAKMIAGSRIYKRVFIGFAVAVFALLDLLLYDALGPALMIALIGTEIVVIFGIPKLIEFLR